MNEGPLSGNIAIISSSQERSTLPRKLATVSLPTQQSTQNTKMLCLLPGSTKIASDCTYIQGNTPQIDYALLGSASKISRLMSFHRVHAQWFSQVLIHGSYFLGLVTYHFEISALCLRSFQRNRCPEGRQIYQPPLRLWLRRGTAAAWRWHKSQSTRVENVFWLT